MVVPGSCICLALAAVLSEPEDFAPPGMVLVEGGPTKIGVPVEEATEVYLQTRLKAVAAETPQHTERLKDFYLMATEVTNEQYLRFVEATGHKPPQHWASAIIDAASGEFLKQEFEKSQADPDYARKTFDREKWWSANWQGKPFAVPKGLERHPVVFVDYQDALAYARWAGLRLMDEFEYQRAGRGETDRRYPWGNEWEDKEYANTFESSKASTTPVGSYPEGAVNGVFDLAGNVWEWTSSPFTAYPKYEPLEIESRGAGGKKEKELIRADWDPNQRVVVGGDFHNTKVAARLTVRRPTDRYQSTDGMGFRCAASARPGVDGAETVLREDLPPQKRPGDVSYETELTVALDKWSFEPIDGAVDRYAAITGYQSMLFVPVEQIEQSSLKELGKDSLEEGPVHLGVLSTTEPLLAPELPAGTYMVAWRDGGEPRKSARREKAAEGEEGAEPGAEADGEEEAPKADPLDALEFDRKQPNFLLFDVDGTPVAAIPGAEVTYERLRDSKATVTEERYTAEEIEEQPGLVPADVVGFEVLARGKSSSKGFAFTLSVKLPPGATEGWRY